MRESIWLKNYEQEVQSKRKQSNEKKKASLIVIPVMLLVALGLAAVNGDSAAANGQNPTMYIVGFFAFMMIFVLIVLNIGKKKDATKNTRKNVQELLRSDEEVEAFDQQMSMEPIKEVKISSDTAIFFTQDYLGKKYLAMGDLNYSFIHREEMAYYDYSKTASTTANPINAAFFFDIRNAENKVILNGLADSGAKLAELEELLRSAKPDIQKR